MMTEEPKFAAPKGEPPAIQFIAPAKLKVDPTYQRSLDGEASRKLVAAIAARWDWRLCVPLLVASRGVDLYIIDGQHRWAAAQMRGDISFLPCAVGQYADAGEEARLFVAANRKRVAVNRLDLYRAALAAGEPATVTINQLLGEAGLSLARHTQGKHLRAGEITSTAILYRLFEKEKEEGLAAVLSTIGSAFGDQIIRYSGVILAAIGQLVPVDMDHDERARLLAVLRRRSADDWATLPDVVRARGGQQRAVQLFFAIRDALLAGTPEAAKQAPVALQVEGFEPPVEPQWCDQCDRNVRPAEAAACRSPFCKLRRAQAA